MHPLTHSETTTKIYLVSIDFVDRALAFDAQHFSEAAPKLQF
jgi:hypothetical protein